LQTDPIRFSAGDGNLYRYVSNNPVNLWDPWGLCEEEKESIPLWNLPEVYNRMKEIEKEEREKNTGHNDASDAQRHAETSRRIAEEFGQAAALAAGYGHEANNLYQGHHGLHEAKMDEHNNAEGREAAKEGRQINPKNLMTQPPSTPASGNSGIY
jgi:hypothetical protein